MTARLALLLVLAACQASRPPPSFAACESVVPEVARPVPAPLHTDGAFFKDAAGRVVLLRGVNLSGDAKVPPFATVRSASDLDPLPGWGLNVLRLLFTWEAFEPQPCAYAEDYLAYIERVVGWAEERGLFVIVDFHQDGYSRFSLDGCGEGFPQWAVLSSMATHTPDNGPRCDGWGVKLTFDAANVDLWRGFHRDTEGARTRYLHRVGRVAARLSSHANVIGYEVLNEPWGQTYELHDLFEDVGSAIRAQDPERMLFIPPHALGLNAEKVSHANIVYAPHYYDSGVYLSKAWGGGSVSEPLERLRGVALAWASPLLLGEFGANEGSRDEGAYLEAIYTWLDERFASGTQWNYTPGWSPTRKTASTPKTTASPATPSDCARGCFSRGLFLRRRRAYGRLRRDAHGFHLPLAPRRRAGRHRIFRARGATRRRPDRVPLDCVRDGHTLRTSIESGEASLTVSD